MDTPRPQDFGYSRREPARSLAEAISKNPTGQERLIGKAALQQYIASFLDDNGANRSLTEAVCPSVSNFVTKYSYDSEEQDKRRVQLRRIYEDEAREVPAIILIDGGSTTVSPGLGAFSRTRGHVDSQYTEAQITRIDQVSVDIHVIADDENTTTNLSGVLTLIFNSAMRFLGGGNLISSSDPSHRWVMTLPLVEPSFGPTSRQNIGDDQQNAVYTTMASLELTVETFGIVAYKIRNPLQDSDLIAGVDHLVSTSYPPVINIATEVPLGVPTEFTIIYDEPGTQLLVDDPRLATVSYHFGRMVINTRRLGTVELRLIRKKGGEVLATQAVTIV